MLRKRWDTFYAVDDAGPSGRCRNLSALIFETPSIKTYLTLAFWPPPADPGMIPLTVPEITRLLTTQPAKPRPPGHAEHWANWRRRPQARSAWYHQRTRLSRGAEIALVSYRMAADSLIRRRPRLLRQAGQVRSSRRGHRARPP